MYNYGTEARELESEVSDAWTVRLERTVKATSGMKNKKALEAFKKKAMKTLAILTAILVVILVRQGKIAQLCGESTSCQNEIDTLNALIMEKEMNRSYQLDMNNIEELAVSRLGMVKPSQSQYVYIDVQKNIGGEILVDSSSNGGFSALVNKAKILLEYFY